MRNFLPAPHQAAKPHRRHFYALAVTLPLVLAAGLIWYKAAHAAPSCTRGYGAVPTATNPGDNALYTEWDAGGYHYRILKFGILGDPRADPGTLINSTDAACGGTDMVDPNNPGLQWNGRTAVAAWLGVPANLGAPNNGIWQNNTSVGLDPRNRPPQFRNNFDSDAALVDDAGRAVIAGGLEGTKTIWCLNLATGGTGGVRDCGPDINTGTNHNGSGHLFIYNNCHLGDPATGLVPPNRDTGGAGPYHCATNAGDEANWSWYVPFLGEGHDSDLSPVIGCTAAGLTNLPCDEASRSLQPFQLHMTSRQTECCGFGAIMYVTMRYPTGSAISITKAITTGATYDEGQTFKYQINVSRPPGVHFTDFHISDTVAGPVTITGTCNPPPTDPVPDPGPGTPQFTFNAARNANFLADLNNDALRGFHFCVQGTTGSIGSAASATFFNHVSIAAHATSGDLVGDSYTTPPATIFSAKHPYITTTGGDVNAGGGVGITCSGSGNITTTPNAKGDYIVSAGQDISGINGNVTGFGSIGVPSTNPFNRLLTTAHYYPSLCRPDLVAGANKATAGCPGTTLCLGGSPTAAQLGAGSRIINVTGNAAIGPATINSPVTLVVHGDLDINGNIQTSAAARPCNSAGCALASFGVIVTGNIHIGSGVTRLDGYYFSSNNINTCYPYGAGQLQAHCTGPLTVNGLLSAGTFTFNRVGPGIRNGAQLGETVNGCGTVAGIYTCNMALLFISPPPIFSNSFTLTQPSGLSEGQAPPQY